MSLMTCHVCSTPNAKFPPWDKRHWACRPCWNDYVRFRRYFKKEHGRLPTFQEFMSDDE